MDLDIKLYEEESVEILSDVYSPVKELVPITSQEVYESLVIKNFSKCRAGERIRMEANQPRMLQICHSKGEVKIDETRITEKGIQVEGAVYVSILYITADDTLPFALMHGMVPFQHMIEVEDKPGLPVLPKDRAGTVVHYDDRQRRVGGKDICKPGCADRAGSQGGLYRGCGGA